MFCKKCGKYVQPTDEFCPYCGERVVKENTDIKENIKILGLLYALGVVSGIIIELVIRLI